MSEKWLAFVLFATPAAIIGFTAILKGYNVLIWRERGRSEHECAEQSAAEPAEE